MNEKIKVRRVDIPDYTNYRFVDGPHAGKLAFSIPKNKGGALGGRPWVLHLKDQNNKKLLYLDAFEVVEPEPKNIVTVKATCGQEMTLELDNIDKNQDISEVTIRGVRYTPA